MKKLEFESFKKLDNENIKKSDIESEYSSHRHLFNEKK
jgi:hypothetical protein